MLRKIGIIAVLSLIVVALAAVPALGAKPTSSGIHFIDEPVCTFSTSGNTASISCEGGSVAGVGSQPVTVFYQAEGGCTTRGNDNEPGGHVQSPSQTVQPNGGRINLEDATITVRCPGGLNRVLDPNSLELVISSATSNQTLATLPVDVT
jgi:hypothetical protein